MTERTVKLTLAGRWRRLALLGFGVGSYLAAAGGCKTLGVSETSAVPAETTPVASTPAATPPNLPPTVGPPFTPIAEMPNPSTVISVLPETPKRVIASPLVMTAPPAASPSAAPMIVQAGGQDKKTDDPTLTPDKLKSELDKLNKDLDQPMRARPAPPKADDSKKLKSELDKLESDLDKPKADPDKKDASALGQPKRLPADLAADADKQIAALKTPTPEPGDVSLPINLAAALRLADARPLVVAAAQASTWVAQANLRRAQVLWIPTMFIGTCYIRHDGPGPDLINGIPIPPTKNLDQNVNFWYHGAGMVNQFTQFTDAIFEPLAARQDVQARQADIQTAKNDALQETANAYFRVHQYRGQYAGARDVVDRGEKLVARIDKLSKDLVPKLEVDRAKKLVADLEQRATAAREEWRVASADLTQVLRLDPRAVVVPLEHDHLQVTLVDANRPLDDLIPIALTNRPELASQQALVREVLVRVRQEKLRPFIPTLYLNGFQTPNEMIQGGFFQTGHGNDLSLGGWRNDVTLQMMWQLDNLGLGNKAKVQQQRSRQSRILVDLFRTQDVVAGDVTRAQARVQSAAIRVTQAERALKQAVITFDGNYEGLEQTTRFDNILVEVYRPQEAVAALDNLRIAYENYFATVAEYNRSQFDLYHALGYPAADVMGLPAVGPESPIDTARPGYLPMVGEGPPPVGDGSVPLRPLRGGP